jgi:serine/threonine protein kinase/Tfp pilus assembly protein PilF
VNAEDWERVKKVLLAAMKRDPSERGSFLDGACIGEPRLRKEVERLVSVAEKDNSFLEKPPLEALEDARAAVTEKKTYPSIARTEIREAPKGQSIGRYRIVRTLGQGGMGIVYEAEQEEPKRAVALKVIRGGPSVDDHAIKLFHREAQALGRLRHPSIAAIYDAGQTEDGQHFFAMELVRGASLSDHVRTSSTNGVSDRRETRRHLRLFVKICDAVNYAHQRGVIHRDLKPANIIVASGSGSGPVETMDEAAPNIKVLDFGLARLTDADVEVSTGATDLGRVQGTLYYMSPEQARGNPDEIDVRSDVYSLGVILYELLTGTLPYDVRKSLPHDVVRVICEQPPTPPRRISGGAEPFDRDLETILFKALEKEPSRRYQSALALAEDLTRYLNNEPILARPQSALYQFRKLVVRNKVPFAFAVSLFVLVTASAIVMKLQRDRAIVAEAIASTEAERAKATNDFLKNILASPNPGQDGRNVKVIEVLAKAAAQLQSDFPSHPETKATLHKILGETYLALGLYDEGKAHLESAFEIRNSVFGKEHEYTLVSMTDLAAAHYFLGRINEAARRERETLELKQAVLGVDHRETLSSMTNLGAYLNKQAKYEEAEAIYRELIDVSSQVLGEESDVVLYSMNNLGYNLKEQGRLEEAEVFYRKALDLRRQVVGENHPDTLATLSNLGVLLREQGKLEQALAMHRDAVHRKEEVLGLEHLETLNSMNHLAQTLCDLDQYEEAESFYIELGERGDRAVPEHWWLAEFRAHYGECLAQMKRYSQAEQIFTESYWRLASALGADHIQTRQVAENLAAVYAAMGNESEAARFRLLAAEKDE